jgi:hypothetical protein
VATPAAQSVVILEPQAYFPLVLKQRPSRVVGYAGSYRNLPDAPFYNWTVGRPNAPENQSRMFWCGSDYHLGVLLGPALAVARVDFESGVIGREWLMFNEPDLPSEWQCGNYPITGLPRDPRNTAPQVSDSPEWAAARFLLIRELILEADPSARFVAGGVARPGVRQAQDWWVRFVGELARRGELDAVDAVHVHGYPRWSVPCDDWCVDDLTAMFEDWYAEHHVGLGLGDKPIYITETGFAPFCGDYEFDDPQAYIDARNRFAKPVLDWFKGPDNPGYERIHNFLPFSGSQSERAAWWCSFMERYPGGELLPISEVWR